MTETASICYNQSYIKYKDYIVSFDSYENGFQEEIFYLHHLLLWKKDSYGFIH
jgi:hypothetical protein